jgi:hypothetical protein
MALVSFGYRVDMFAIDPPLEVGAYIVAYDLDGVLKQKDHLGVVTLVGAGAGGPQGPPGPVGPAGLTWSGTWMATQSYSLNYAVGYGSASWWCISDVTGATSNTGPDVDTTHWALLAAQGSPGSQGGTGTQGLQGPQGEIGLNWIGNWIVNVYDVRDAVYYNGSSYVCIASTVGTETLSPDTNTSCWDIISLKGDVGAQGATGPQGPIGLSGSNGDSYWIATGSNIINTSNSTVIVSGPTASGEIAIKSPDFIGAAELTGFGIYNSGTVAGTYFYGSWFNSAPGYGLQDFTAQTKFYIDATTFNWVSNKPISIGTGTASNIRFLVSSSGGTTSLVVTEDGRVGIGTNNPSTKLHVYATQSGALRLQDGTEGSGKILVSDSNGVGTWTASSSGVVYWTATGSNIINANPTGSVIINNPAGGVYDLAFKTATFTDYAGQNGFGVYNGGNVGGHYFYGTWFNTPAGGGLQDFSGYTRFYINPSSPYNWISNQPINIGIGTASNSRFVVSSSGGTVSLVVTEDGSVYNRGGGNNDSNTAFGNGALVLNTPDGGGYLGSNGTYNVALGTGAMGLNTTGYSNLAIGAYTLYYSTNGTYNVAIGGSALQSNTSGSQNMAIGGFSLYLNQTGIKNTAIGTSALQNSISGSYNTSIGNFSGYNITYASSNTLIGFQAGSGITTGSNNTIIADTGYAGSGGGVTTGSNNLIVAQNNGNTTGITTGSNNTIIGKVTGLATGLSASVILSDGLGNIRFYSDNNGNSAIGTTSPSTKLHVYATQSGAFRLQDGTQASGYVLTSDSNGVASWTSSVSILTDYNFKNIDSSLVSGTYSVLATDYTKTLVYTGTSSINVVLSTGTTYSVGRWINVLQKGTGQITIAANGFILSYSSDELPTTFGANSLATVLVYSTSTPELIISGKLKLA